MKRIAIISDHASASTIVDGQNVYVEKIAQELAAKGHKVDVFTRADEPSQPQIVNWKGNLRVINIEAGPKCNLPKDEIFPYMESFTSNLIQWIEEENIAYDLVHAHFFMSAWVAMNLKNLLEIPFVVTFHALGKVQIKYQKHDRFPENRIRIEEQVCHEANAIIAECPEDYKDLVNLYGTDPDKIYLIPCGVDSDELHPLNKEYAKHKAGLDPHKKYLLQLGGMVPRKGIDTVIKGFAQLKSRAAKDTELLIVGGDQSQAEELGRLKLVARHLGVEERVHFLGAKPRGSLKYYYNSAEIFLTTPWYEPFGITPLESMACGTPVIGSRIGGIKYAIENQQTGILIAPKNPQSIARTIEKLMAHPEKIHAMGEQGVRRINQHFTWEKVVSKLIKIYTKVASNSPKIPVITIPKDAIIHAFDQSVLSQYSSQQELESAIVEAITLLWQSLSESTKYKDMFSASIAGRHKDFLTVVVKRSRNYHDKIVARVILFLPQFYQTTQSLYGIEDLIEGLEEDVRTTNYLRVKWKGKPS